MMKHLSVLILMSLLLAVPDTSMAAAPEIEVSYVDMGATAVDSTPEIFTANFWRNIDYQLLRQSRSYIKWMDSIGGWAWLIIAGLFLLQTALLATFNDTYDYQQNIIRRTGVSKSDFKPASVWPGYAAVFVSLLLTAWQLWGIVDMRGSASSTDFFYLGLVLSTGLVGAVLPWRIHLSSLYEPSDDNPRGRSMCAKFTGGVCWLLLLVPIVVALMGIHTWFTLRFDFTSVWAMVITVAVVLIAYYIMLAVVMNHTVAFLLMSMNSMQLGVAYFFVALSLGWIGFNVVWDTFDGLTAVFGAVLTFFGMLWVYVTCYCQVRYHRCGHCHNYAGLTTGTTDHGYSYSTSDEWRGTSDSKIRSKRSYAEVEDAQKLVRTTYRHHKWTDHQVCGVCGDKWDIDQETKRAVGEQVLGHRWTERWVE